jgi:cell division protease FtsH
MVTLYGMNEKLGNATYNEPGGQFLEQQQLFRQREISDETAKLIDDEVRDILTERMETVKQLLATKKELLEKVASVLLEKETLESEEFLELIGHDKKKKSKKSDSPKKAKT